MLHYESSQSAFKIVIHDSTVNDWFGLHLDIR
jgi:hypothetical protein